MNGETDEIVTKIEIVNPIKTDNPDFDEFFNTDKTLHKMLENPEAYEIGEALKYAFEKGAESKNRDIETTEYRFLFVKKDTDDDIDITYEIIRKTSRTAREIFRDAHCLLDFGLFDEVRIFDKSGKELTELY